MPSRHVRRVRRTIGAASEETVVVIGIDVMHLHNPHQMHHIDTDYYNRFFGSGAYGPTHAAHMTTWHR